MKTIEAMKAKQERRYLIVEFGTNSPTDKMSKKKKRETKKMIRAMLP